MNNGNTVLLPRREVTPQYISDVKEELGNHFQKGVIVFKLFKPKFSPSLIDLVQYEKDLLYAVEHHDGEAYTLLLRPVPSIPGLVVGSWSESEMQAMRDNRKQAQEIYERIASRLPNKASTRQGRA